MVLTVSSCSSAWDLRQVLRAVVSQDAQILSLLQTGLCLAPLSGRAFESDRIPVWPTAGPCGTSEMVPRMPHQTPVQRTCVQHREQKATTRSMDRRGPAARLPSHRGGLPGSSCRRNPCLYTGVWSSSFLTDWGLSAAEEGREELHTQSKTGNTKWGSVIPRQSSTGPLPSLGSCLGPGFQN